MSKDIKNKDVKKNTGISKEYKLSIPLRIVCGQPRASRGQVMKLIWDYIKKNELQDPKDKRNINCDSNLEKVFKVKKIGMFKIAGGLREHLLSDAK